LDANIKYHRTSDEKTIFAELQVTGETIENYTFTLLKHHLLLMHTHAKDESILV
jgi:hypothetical protein